MSDAEEIPASSGMNVAPVHDLPTRRVDALKVALSLCLCYTLLIAFVRVYIRRNLYGPDDWTAFGATVSPIPSAKFNDHGTQPNIYLFNSRSQC